MKIRPGTPKTKPGTTGTNTNSAVFRHETPDGSLITTNPEVAERLEINSPGFVVRTCNERETARNRAVVQP